jgi:hypothetical protein
VPTFTKDKLQAHTHLFGMGLSETIQDISRYFYDKNEKIEIKLEEL